MKNVKYFFAVVQMLLTYSAFSQITKADADTLFKLSEAKIAGEGRTCSIINFLAGDLNHDGSDDLLIYYSCGIKETIGKGTTGGGWAVWVHKEGTLQFLLSDEKKFGLAPKQILPDGNILCDQLGYDSNSAKPSIIGQRKVKLGKNGLALTR